MPPALPPYYPRGRLQSIKPSCYDQPGVLPDPPAGRARRQYVAIVIRRASGVAAVDSVADLVDDFGDESRPAGWPPARRGIVRQAAADHVGASAPNGQPPVRAANAS